MRKGSTRAIENKRIRREALIEQLKNKGLCQAVMEDCERLSNTKKKLTPVQVQRLKASNDGRLALIRKYLPDAKTVEVTGEDGDSIKVDTNFTVNFV